MEKDNLKTLKPNKEIEWLSFSEKREVALEFANPKSSLMPKGFSIGDNGYLITYKPEPKEIFFHHSMLNKSIYEEVFEKDIAFFKNQFEVMLFQNMKTFNLESVNH